MTALHIPTLYLVIGFLYLVLPAIVWMVLAQQASETARMWCLGGTVLAIGLLLIGARASISAWLSYPLANALAWMGILMQALALRRALDMTWRIRWMVLTVIVWLCIFEYFRQALNNTEWRFAWSTLFFAVVFSYIAHLAWRIASIYSLKSGRWLSLVYALAALILLIRMGRVLMHWSEPDAVAQSVDSLLAAAIGILISVVGSFTFVSMFLERATKKELQATEQRVRQEESARLGEQIAQLDRQRALGEMSYSFAHELSQPLTAILMDAHTIKQNLVSESINHQTLGDAVQGIERNATRTAQLIDRIRHFIRPSPGDFETVDMKVLVQDVRELLLHDIRQQKIAFDWTLDVEPCTVMGDKVQLSQIVLNVYRNALQAMAQSHVRTLYVSVDRQEQRVVVRIRDTGLGLAQSIKQRVGEPFVTSKADGLGVGLLISKAIAERHGGSLTIANAVDGGALVELNLPAAVD